MKPILPKTIATAFIEHGVVSIKILQTTIKLVMVTI
jgi:hypothetical protein